jgi:hypothetical protein
LRKVSRWWASVSAPTLIVDMEIDDHPDKSPEAGEAERGQVAAEPL